jgi:hypothetical protein
MDNDQCNKRGEAEPVGVVLARLMAKVRGATQEAGPETPATEPTTDEAVTLASRSPHDGPAVYDFDLAEFPLFSFAKRPARDRLGVGGATAHPLLFDLLQLYAEQGGRAPVIHFSTLRSLFLRRERNPSKKDYDRMRRDFAVLRGYDFTCKNAYGTPAATPCGKAATWTSTTGSWPPGSPSSATRTSPAS